MRSRPTPPPPGGRSFLGRVRELLSTHLDTRGRTQLELPYTTRAYRLAQR